MAEITYNYEEIIPHVKPYRGYDDFIHSIRIKVSATDGNNTVETVGIFELNVDQEFTEENPFVPFDRWDRAKVLQVADSLLERAKTKERLQMKLKVAAAKPKPKNFNI
jgi:hypothetical protein